MVIGEVVADLHSCRHSQAFAQGAAVRRVTEADGLPVRDRRAGWNMTIASDQGAYPATSSRAYAKQRLRASFFVEGTRRLLRNCRLVPGEGLIPERILSSLIEVDLPILDKLPAV